jgi:hypothetical protein
VRRFLTVMLLSALTIPAFAADPAKPSEHHARMTWKNHFVQANLAHDGHLTLHEATGGYPQIAKHFDDIDANHKGYVTENDIQAWRAMRKAAHRRAPASADRLKPINAMQLGPVRHKPIPVSAAQTVAMPPDQPAGRPAPSAKD